MIFITVVICYVDRANLAVASAHIQGRVWASLKAEMGYVFSAFCVVVYALPDPRRLVPLTAWVRVLNLFYRYFGWSVATLPAGLATGLDVVDWSARDHRDIPAPAFPNNNRMVTSWFPGARARISGRFYTSGQFVGLAFPDPLLIWIQETLSWHWVFIVPVDQHHLVFIWL